MNLSNQLMQRYPPGAQKNYNRFSSRNPITEKGKELEFPEGAGGGKGYRGHEVASTLRREASLREPGVPPKLMNKNQLLCIPRIENITTREYIAKIFTKLNIGKIEQISEIPLRNDAKHKRVIIKVNWTESENTNFIQSRLERNESVKVVHDFPWYWKVASFRKGAGIP